MDKSTIVLIIVFNIIAIAALIDMSGLIHGFDFLSHAENYLIHVTGDFFDNIKG
jgi:hypothetical protein